MMAARKKPGNDDGLGGFLGGSGISGATDQNEDSLRMSFFKNQSSAKNRFAFIDQIPVLRTRIGVSIVTAIVTVAITLGLSSLFAPNQLDTTTLAARISGGVALSEDELKEVVRELGETVYWAGPVRGAKYTINAQNTGAIYVRYLPGGKDISDNSPRFRVIATYKEENGVIYYNKNSPTNVYVAFKTQPYQIEIFDPEAETSLAIANDSEAIQPIE
jgi:hypothetical protein